MKHSHTHYIKLDSRNRLSLTKIAKNIAQFYKVTIQGNKIILEPIREMPEEAHWLFDQGNEHLLEELKKALKEKGSIDRGSFAKYLDDEAE